MIIGLFCGVLVYRTSYAAILNFYFNHIPLPPFALHQRFSYHLSTYSDRSSESLETSVEYASRLIIFRWWGQATKAFLPDDTNWPRIVTDMKQIWGAKMEEGIEVIESNGSCTTSLTPESRLSTSIHSVPGVSHPTIDCGRSRNKSLPANLC